MASNIRSITSLDPNTLYASKYYKYRKYTFTMQYHGSELVGTKGIYSVSFEYYNVSKLTLDSSGRLMFPNSSYAGYYEAGSLNAANATVGYYAVGYGYVYQILNSSGNYYFRFYGGPYGTATVIEDIAINIDDLPGQYQCRYGRSGAIYGTDGTYYYDQIGRANYSNF